MLKDGKAARKKAFEFMRLAAKAPSDERRDILSAMARSWVTLANHMDRFEATSVSVRSDARSERERRRAAYIRQYLN
jgi:hypothetical protein